MKIVYRFKLVSMLTFVQKIEIVEKMMFTFIEWSVFEYKWIK